MSRTVVGLVLGLVLLLLLVASAPARLLTSLLPEQQLILQGVSGTVWRGKASRALVAVQGGWMQLGATEWSLSPLSLLLFSPAVALESHWGRQTLVAELRLQSSDALELSNVDVLLDAGLSRQFLPVGLAGDVNLQFDEILIQDQLPVSASGRLVWQGAGWISPQGRRPLGSYAVDVTTADDGMLLGEVITLAGDLQAQGSLRLQQRQYGIDVTLDGPGLRDPQLTQALQLVAVPQGEGFRVRLDGEL